MSKKEFGGTTYAPDDGSVLIGIRKISYSEYSSQEGKRNIVIGGEGVVYFDDFEVIDNGYKNNILFVRISSWSNESNSSNSQKIEAKSKKWSSFAGLYYHEEIPLELDGLVYQDDSIEEINSTSKIYLDLYIDEKIIELIIRHYGDNNLNGFNITVDFIDLLSKTFSYPGSTKFIPPKENENFFNSVGVLKGLSFLYQPKYFDYVEATGFGFSTITNKKSPKYYNENNNNALFNKVDESISILKSHVHLIIKMINQLKKIEKLLLLVVIILILLLIYKVF